MDQYEAELKREQDALEYFFSCIEKNAIEEIPNAWHKIQSLPRLRDYEDKEKGILSKADFLGDSRIQPTAQNEKMHPYISKFFDLAVYESKEMRFIESWEDAHQRENSGYSRQGYIDHLQKSSNDGILKWMQSYKSLAAEFSAKGKEIFIPESFLRYAELEKFAFNTIHYTSGKLAYKKEADGTEREWYENGAIKSVCSPDGTKIGYNHNNEVIYHATAGKEDTVVYLAKQRVESSREKGMKQLEDAPRFVQKIATKIADSPTFNDIAFKHAVKKVKDNLLRK